MEKLDEIWMPRIYEAVSAPVRMPESKSVVTLPIMYSCNCCGTEFILTYKWHGYMSGGWQDKEAICPGCGKRLSNYGRVKSFYRGMMEYSNSSEAMPVNLGLKLYKIRNGYKLAVTTDTKTLRCWGLQTEKKRYTETVTFDVKNRRTVWRKRDFSKVELGNMFNRDFYERSLIKFINRNVVKDPERSKHIRDIFRQLREGIRKDFKRFHGYDIGSLWISIGTEVDGWGVVPVSYLATRLLMPDLNINTSIFQMDTANLRTFLNKKGLSEEHYLYLDNPNDEYLFRDLDIFRKTKDSVSAVIEALHIPDKTAYRRAITENGPVGTRALKVFSDVFPPDLAVDLWENHYRLWDFGYQCSSLGLLEQYLNKWVQEYDLKDIYRTLSGVRSFSYLMDIDNMKEKLTKENQVLFKQVKLQAAHDWLVQKLMEQREADFELEVPEHVKKRLEMQSGQVKFYMPETHWKLRDIGAEFHNCVGSYAQRVLKGQCCIVIMTDDDGKMMACLEVKDDRLVQAKLKFNRPVYVDMGVNTAICEWCKKTKLKINTKDVKLKYEELESKTA